MKNKIDKDVNLFLPQEFNFLLLGGNFLFSKRLYEIMKREYKIKRIDYKHDFVEEYFSCIDSTTFKIDLEPYKKIKALVNLHNSDTIIFTSEILLFLSQYNYTAFFSTLKKLKEDNIRFVFISVKSPLHICKKLNGKNELSNMSSRDWYHSRLKEIKGVLNPNKDLIYEFSSYCTYLHSNLQANPIQMLDKDKTAISVCEEEKLNSFSLNVADDIISDIVNNLSKTNRVVFNHTTNDVTLEFIVNDFFDGDLYSYVSKQARCSLHLIYRKKPNEVVNNSSVAEWRFKLGSLLKTNIPQNVIDHLDVIVPIPETGKYYAQGLAHSLNKPYIEAFYKQSEIGRSFDINNKQQREQFIYSKLGVLPDLVNGKNIGIVDEGIFTGQTTKIVRKLLENTSVNKIYFFIASPVCRNKCKLNMQPDRNLLCEHKTIDDLVSYFNIDGIFFQDLDSFGNILSSSGFDHTCCFSK